MVSHFQPLTLQWSGSALLLCWHSWQSGSRCSYFCLGCCIYILHNHSFLWSSSNSFKETDRGMYKSYWMKKKKKRGGHECSCVWWRRRLTVDEDSIARGRDTDIWDCLEWPCPDWAWADPRGGKRRTTWRCIQEGKRPIKGLISKMNHWSQMAGFYEEEQLGKGSPDLYWRSWG